MRERWRWRERNEERARQIPQEKEERQDRERVIKVKSTELIRQCKRIRKGLLKLR